MPHPNAFSAQYIQRILALDPIAYWPLGDKYGTAAWDISRNGRHGIHANVALGQPGIGDGGTSCLYDGGELVPVSYTDVWTPSFRDAFNGNEGTILVWLQVANVGVWTDGVARTVVRLVGTDENIFLAKLAENNLFRWYRRAGGVTDLITTGGHSEVNFLSLAMTWSVIDDQLIAYRNGVQTGATQGTLGNWGTNLVTTRCCIGAVTTEPGEVWDGYINHVTILDRALSPVTMRSLYRIQ